MIRTMMASFSFIVCLTPAVVVAQAVGAPSATDGQTRAMAARAAARKAELLAELPSVEKVKEDMKDAGEPDTDARIMTALHWLAIISERLEGSSRAKASVYAQARERYAAKHPNRCADEAGCDPDAEGAFSRFYRCRSAYETSPEFLRSIIDAFIPDSQYLLSELGISDQQWLRALALRVGLGEEVSTPTLECSGTGQLVKVGPRSSERSSSPAATEDGLDTKAQERRKARFAADAPAIALALTDGKRAKKAHIDTVYGVPLGTSLALPDCEAVGHRERSLSESLVAGLESSILGSTQVQGTVMVSPENCLLVDSDGSTTVVWAKGGLPTWATSVSTVVKGDVLVSVRIEFDSVFQPPSYHVLYGPTSVVAQNEASEAYYEAAWKHGPDNVASAQKALRNKYGPPDRPIKKSKHRYYKDGPGQQVEEPEWHRDGLHVKYTADQYEDNVVIELESFFNSRSEAGSRGKAAEPQL